MDAASIWRGRRVDNPPAALRVESESLGVQRVEPPTTQLYPMGPIRNVRRLNFARRNSCELTNDPLQHNFQAKMELNTRPSFPVLRRVQGSIRRAVHHSRRGGGYPPATTSTSSIRQLLGAADTQTAHHATFSTAPTHQLLGSANAETTPARAPAAAADRKQRPDATCEGKNG